MSDQEIHDTLTQQLQRLAINDGGPAFPYEGIEHTGYSPIRPIRWSRPGMTLRDWFAGQAIAHRAEGTDPKAYQVAARHAYRYADALLAERAK